MTALHLTLKRLFCRHQWERISDHTECVKCDAKKESKGE